MDGESATCRVRAAIPRAPCNLSAPAAGQRKVQLVEFSAVRGVLAHFAGRGRPAARAGDRAGARRILRAGNGRQPAQGGITRGGAPIMQRGAC